MKIFLFFFLVLISNPQYSLCQIQKNEKIIYIKDFKWTITIPENFDSIKAIEWERLKNVGKSETLNSTGVTVIPSSKTILAFKKQKINYIDASYTIIDYTDKEEYLEVLKYGTSVIYNTFKTKLPNSKLDTLYSEEKIDGLLFQTFKLIINISKSQTIEVRSYSRIFGDKQFVINIIADNEENLKFLLNAWENSKFEIE
jgi:hypothetical protein